MSAGVHNIYNIYYIIAKTLDLGVYVVSFREYSASDYYENLKLRRASDSLCGLSFSSVS